MNEFILESIFIDFYSSERSPDRVLNQDFYLILLETFFVSSIGFVSSRGNFLGAKVFKRFKLYLVFSNK